MKGKGSNKDTMKQVEMCISGVDNKNLKKINDIVIFSITVIVHVFFPLTLLPVFLSLTHMRTHLQARSYKHA